ncbi:MAG: GNAT family N-acetyltransferase [Ktedonobacteraceae bacterium]
MDLNVEPVARHEAISLLPLLLDADESEERIRAALLDPSCTAYACRLTDQLVGAAVVRWEVHGLSEILYIGVDRDLRGRGYGKQMMQALRDELPRHGGRSLLVGTASASLENIAFYQRCGFRMYEIRRDYFAYIQPPVLEHGIPILDMLVLRYDLE